MDSICGNSIKPNETTNKWFVFDGKWVGGFPGGLVLEVRMLVNASSMLPMPDQPTFRKITKPGNCYFSEKTVFAKTMFLWFWNDKPQRPKWLQKPHEDIMCSWKSHFVMVFANRINVFHENLDFRFSVWLIHSMESMESINSMESMDSMESMQAMESEVKYIRWW